MRGESARDDADRRVLHLIEWIREHMLEEDGKTWRTDLSDEATPRRLLIFTEYTDTKRYLEEHLRAALAGTDDAARRVGIFVGRGAMVGSRGQEEIRRAFNADPAEGLTATYNRFHDPEERDPGILRLRELHDEMDRAVLDAYGWHDIRPTCEFLLDYEVEDDEPGKRRKKKPWRYRWPDEIRDKVLGRLLELNEERAKEERRLGMEPELKAGNGEIAGNMVTRRGIGPWFDPDPTPGSASLPRRGYIRQPRVSAA